MNKNFFIAAVVILISYYLTAGAFMLVEWDELIYSNISKNMLLNSDYLRLFINNQAFSEKPPLFFWLQSLSFKAFGINEFAARLPSILSVTLTAIFFLVVGKKILNLRYSLLWGLIYLTSFFPLILNRSATIDPLFNLLIAVGIYNFYFYNKNLLSKLASNKYLIIAAIALGLSVLSKGVTGLMLACVYALYEIVKNKRFIYPLKDILIGSAIILFIGSSWYILSWLYYGDIWVKGFIDFQRRLINTVAESHDGPFYYHCLIVILGLLPWSFFVTWFKQKENTSTKDFLKFNLLLILVVVIFFSFVQTKLPHYSAFAYIPFSAIIAWSLLRLLENKQQVNWYKKTIISFGILLPALVILFSPYLLNQYSITRESSFAKFSDANIYLLFCPAIAALIAIAYLIGNSFKKSFYYICLEMLLLSQLLCFIILPRYLQIDQGALYSLVETANKIKNDKKIPIILFNSLNFGPFFYQDLVAGVAGSYKFKDDSDWLKDKNQLLILTENDALAELENYGLKLELLDKKGVFRLYLKNEN